MSTVNDLPIIKNLEETKMNYKVHDSKTGKVFGSLKEASAYAEEIRKKTRIIVAITETKASATHTYQI